MATVIYDYDDVTLCDECAMAQATKIVKVEGESKYMCEECAQEVGSNNFEFRISFRSQLLNYTLFHLLKHTSSLSALNRRYKNSIRCVPHRCDCRDR